MEVDTLEANIEEIMIEMKRIVILLGLIILCNSCQEVRRKGRPFPEVNTDSVMAIPTDEEHAEVIKVSDNVKSKVLSSELIEDFYYIPLETTDESLFAYCNNLEFYEDKIYLFDRLGTKRLFLFDQSGTFIKYIGDKGGAPYEFYLPMGIALDPKRKQIIVFDNMKSKLMKFSLEGDFLEESNVDFLMNCSFQTLPSGNYVYAISKGDQNYHLKEYNEYKLLFTDSIGNIIKAAYTYPETEYSSLMYDALIRKGNDILYFPMYMNEIYTVTDTALNLRYHFDYTAFSPFDKNKMGTFDTRKEFVEYRSSHTYLSSYAENETHIFFVTKDKGGNKFITFYDKESSKSINCTSILFDMDFAVKLDQLFNYKDYFVGLVEPETLKGLKKHIETTTHYPMKEENRKMIENLKDDDNMVLVFFKIKAL